MPKILKLEAHVADLIAAGEVVERPGSVIKELVENSIDAGADSLTIEIKNGGMTYIRVTDNGCGIAPEDTETAFLRHATSKLRDERGLEAIGTLGFRGEALAAIAAVSRIELLTREQKSGEGTRLLVEGGIVLEKLPAGCPEGTTIIVRDIFFNTPARLKFVKNDKAEGANISSVVLKCALSHPEISIRYIKDGKEEFHTPGDARTDSCIYSLLGREFAAGLLNIKMQENDGIKVAGYVSSPAHLRGNRSFQFFFVNGRFIRSKMLQAALEQAYKNSLFTGRFPSCVLYVALSCAAVDVNVHPTKSEVKFLHERQVFDAVYYAVLSSLEAEKETAGLKLPDETLPENLRKKPADEAPYKNSFFKSVPADKFSAGFSSGGFKTKVPAMPQKSFYESVHDETRVIYQTKLDMPEHSANHIPYPKAEVEDKIFRIIGEGLYTYIIVEKGNSLVLIDKHAAHERMIFDRLKNQKREIMTQMLISPIICDMSAEEIACLLENKELLLEFGFDYDEFGERSIALRQLPADIETGEAQALMSELYDKLVGGAKMDPGASRDEILHSIACKAAIKAGKHSEADDITELVSKVLSNEVKYCPHGRPVAMELTKTMLDKNFKRV